MPDDQSEGLSEKEWFELPNWLFTQPYNARERNWGPWPDIPPSSSPLGEERPIPLDPEILNVSVPGADGELTNWEDFPLVT